LKLFYTDHFELPLPVGHRFPMAKYRLLRRRIVEGELHRDDCLLVPPAVNFEELCAAHDAEYVRRVFEGRLSVEEIKRIGFPWSEKMVERSRRSSGATLAAARVALKEQVAVNLAGGTHHAMRAAGEGYCVFNDAAVAVRNLIRNEEIKRGVIIDCDVHQGNGTAEILVDDENVFTFSIHGEKNFPLRKFPSRLDIDLPDGTNDEDYLRQLSVGLEKILTHGPFDLAVYLAGADPYESDRLGRLSLTKEGLRQRDRLVFTTLMESRVPVAVAMAGGYAPDVDDIVDIHAATIAEAKRIELSKERSSSH
jgi:acetoin utilization deacetylase AcuC-like enzyme